MLPVRPLVRWSAVLGALLTIAAVAAFDPPDARAHGRSCFPVAGRFEASPVPPPECVSPVGLCTRGTLTGGLRGTYEFVAASFIPSGAPTVPAITFYTGESHIQTRGGATLTGTDTGTIDLDPSRDGAISALLTFTGGTGHLAGATGQLHLSGRLDFATGGTSGLYAGKVCFAD